MTNLELELEIKNLIIDTLMLEDISANDINSEDALFVTGLGLDSIDALELGVALQKKYGVQLSGAEDNKHYFSSIRSLAAMVIEKRTT